MRAGAAGGRLAAPALLRARRAAWSSGRRPRRRPAGHTVVGRRTEEAVTAVLRRRRYRARCGAGRGVPAPQRARAGALVAVPILSKIGRIDVKSVRLGTSAPLTVSIDRIAPLHPSGAAGMSVA